MSCRIGKYFTAAEGSTPAATVTDPSSRLLCVRVAVRALVNLTFHERQVDATQISAPQQRARNVTAPYRRT